MIELKNIRLNLGRRFTLDIESLVSDSALVILKGSNGSGKSTFLHLLLGLRKAQQGKLTLGDKPVPFNRQFINYALGYTFLPKSWTLKNALQFELKNRPKDELEDIRRQLLSTFKADSFLDKRFDQMSAGMYQKSNLLLSLCGQPKFLLLDEPEAHLDEESIQGMFDVFNTLLSKGITIICATHTTHYWSKLLEAYPSKVLEFPLKS